MAISVDSVYQTVQRILNVEQRGQLPPADFNRFAKLAQDELFNNLFYDKAHFQNSPKGTMMLNMEQQEKIDVFVRHSGATDGDPVSDTDTTLTNTFTLPTDLYSLTNVYYDRSNGTRVVVENIKHKDSRYVLNSPLTCPNDTFPKYLRFNSETAEGVGNIEVYPNTITSGVRFEYIKRPSTPEWAYIRLGTGTSAAYDSMNSTDFELHHSMEDDLVMKVLFYAGISTRQDDIAQYANRSIQEDQAIDKQ